MGVARASFEARRGFGVKLLDFGIARLLDDTALPHPAAITHAYASPARLAGSVPIRRARWLMTDG